MPHLHSLLTRSSLFTSIYSASVIALSPSFPSHLLTSLTTLYLSFPCCPPFSPFLWPLPTGSDAILWLLRAITGSGVGAPAKQGRHHTTLSRKATAEERREVGRRKKGRNEANERKLKQPDTVWALGDRRRKKKNSYDKSEHLCFPKQKFGWFFACVRSAVYPLSSTLNYIYWRNFWNYLIYQTSGLSTPTPILTSAY